MSKPFESLATSKQQRIINAALKEFTDKGFEQASTNQIVKDAGIGKGMLFYYFNSKKDLYLYLIKYCLDITEHKYFSLIDANERDLFERLKKIALVKSEFLKKYPDAMNFISTIVLNGFEEMDDELQARMEAMKGIGYEKMYGNLDESLFREDIDAKKAYHLIRWTFAGYEEELKNRLRDQDMRSIDFEPYFAQFFDYLDVMRTCFYK
ncbi:MAG: TetR/AcrR family transcriptional regulator [Candidatus Cohnella colombiensis]|uniref:TetR/AcrR family transcriptional regulator n=1 Tax=Candidatus Cohnella colombiensis TaxID=3121368 RepID=A0AA95EY99_9BACL|nr:MAG: TetR/AcrR family transcriptional regulator [Cohnella sp.]